ncbi:MAG: hypothetical protein MI922_16820, partial [Bacteroidales bacterium]|nr:hypothetical protein [Bacteroidales bacterium]
GFSKNGIYMCKTFFDLLFLIGGIGDAADESAFTYYAAADTYVVTVHPAPVTGPIYQIPSGWAN